jgi:hypothetical protein
MSPALRFAIIAHTAAKPCDKAKGPTLQLLVGCVGPSRLVFNKSAIALDDDCWSRARRVVVQQQASSSAEAAKSNIPLLN